MTLSICLAPKDYLINDNLFTCTCSLFESICSLFESSFIHYMLRQKWRGGGAKPWYFQFYICKVKKSVRCKYSGGGRARPPSMLRACVCGVCTRCTLEYYNVAKTEVWMNSSISIDPGGRGQMNIWTFVTTTYIVL